MISPVHKAGPADKPEHYSAVGLINCLCKIFMNVLTLRLTTRVEANNVIDESQAGFRKDYSTTYIFNSCFSSNVFMSRERKILLYFCGF